MIFDSKLTWNEHIKYIKAKAMRSLNLLKILSHSKYGSDRKTMLRLLEMSILPIIDYGSILYESASDNQLIVRNCFKYRNKMDSNESM